MVEMSYINLEDLTSEIGIDTDAVVELLNIYCSEMSEEMQQVKRYIANQDWTRLQKTIHNIKGVSANLYLKDMLKTAEVLDLKLKKNDHDSIEDSIQSMLETFDATCKNIQEILGQSSLVLTGCR